VTEGAESAATDGATTGAADARPRVLSVGHLNWDVTIHVPSLPGSDEEIVIDRLVQSGGGSAANVAAGLVGLGTPTAVYGSVGADAAGGMALRELGEAGVDPGNVLVDPEGRTSVKYLVVDPTGEVMVLSNDGANEAFTAADLDPAVYDRVEHVHLTGQAPDTAAAVAAEARERGRPVSFDPGRRVGTRDYAAALRATDLLFLNEREAAAVAADGVVSPTEPDDVVAVVKRGGDGAAVYTPTGSVSHAGFPVEAVDTTGAGDAFAAGFLAALLDRDPSEADGEPLPSDPGAYEGALAVGNACGALAAREASARVPLSWGDVETLVDRRRDART